MSEGNSRRAGNGDPLSPMSFFMTNLYTITETEGSRSVRSLSQRMSLEVLDGDNSSTRSSGLTALPRWESLKNSSRPRLHVPLPVIPRRAHVRQDSQTPILENEALAKDASGVHRSDSQRSRGRSGASSPEEDEQPRHGRTMIWLVAIVVVVLALAIILGAVLGTFVSPGHSGPQPSITEIPAGTTPTPTAPAGGNSDSESPLATPHIASVSATGWSVPGSQGYHSIWLFWQNSKGYLSTAAFNSSTGNWTRISSFAEAKKGTPLAASALDAEWYAGQENYSFPSTQYQTSVTYLDGKNYLNEWIFPDSGPEIGQPGPINDQKYIAHEDTRLASYWPHTIYQGLSGEIRGAHYACHEKNECWHERVLDTTEASNGTRLAVVPMENSLSLLGLFYQEEGGRLLEYKENSDEVGELWENGAFSHFVPINASVAAFSTTRSGDPKDPSLNIYLLWQNTNGTIHMSWADNDEGWKGPITHPAFAGAEKNTALTCLTGLTFPNSPLPAGTELARCYFQTGLALREVSFDGDSWNIVGIVPIDL